MSDIDVGARDDARAYRAHHDRLRSFAVRMLRDEATAEDVASEALARGWSRREGLGSDDAFSAWTYRVARNLCIDHLRRRKRLVSLDAIGDRASVDADVAAPLEREEEHRFVRDAFAMLNDRHKEALYLRDIEGVEYDELARVIGTTPDSARQVVTRARKGLRRIVELVAEGALGAMWWVRLRTRALTERGSHVSAGVARAVEAALVLGVVATIGVFPTPSAPERLEDRESGSARPGAAVTTPRTRADAGGIARPSSVLSASLRRPGESEVRATVPLGPAGEQQVWASTWREDEETPSAVLSVVDEAAGEACSLAPSACDDAGVLSIGGER